MINASIKFTAAQEKVSKLRDVLTMVLGPTQAMSGCISCRLYQEESDPNSWLLLEEWDSEEAMERHVKSSSYRNILEAMELASEVPEVKFTTGSKTEGFELIESIRGESK